MNYQKKKKKLKQEKLKLFDFQSHVSVTSFTTLCNHRALYNFRDIWKGNQRSREVNHNKYHVSKQYLLIMIFHLKNKRNDDKN